MRNNLSCGQSWYTYTVSASVSYVLTEKFGGKFKSLLGCGEKVIYHEHFSDRSLSHYQCTFIEDDYISDSVPITPSDVCQGTRTL